MVEMERQNLTGIAEKKTVSLAAENSSVHEWQRMIQAVIAQIDESIKGKDDDALSLSKAAETLGYSEFHFSKKFREISGMAFRDYLRYRRLAFALKEIRDTDRTILDIALEYGFSSHEAFTRAFKDAYCVSPKDYRKNPVPVVLRTMLRPFDCYLLSIGDSTMKNTQTSGEVKTYFVTIPEHKFLHIRNYESIGYFDFWEKQSKIPGQDCQTICGILESIKGKLDDEGGTENDSGSGQLMAFLNAPEGRICSWGLPLAECYGVRLSSDWSGIVPKQMILSDIPEGEYIVFEHGPFDFETENQAVEAKIEEAMKNFDWSKTGYELDTTPGRIFYFYHDTKRFWKYVRPVRKVEG
ncbi:helix-turn-helix domain-containing protein [Treponema porcinum]|uniref:helix-turn-helix domain-containing protein n=1 Tax=Treponema porcinum TaxID=261392 RepID=UPI002355A28B|nr:helix-turn-helix transcriptional regulator [Treponema porcinum]MCI6481982.1 helix-turn-helix transcriptional regulator [Treponema porcinum]